jgi:hypothetical protein
MLGESALEYNADARDRGLVKPAGALVPSAGKQFVTVRAAPGAVKRHSRFPV